MQQPRRSEFAGHSLDRLTLKEREVLDLVVQHHTSKEIARHLELAPNTVDMRLRSARNKLGARDRNDIARIYRDLLENCGKSTCGPTVMSPPASDWLAAAPETPSPSEFLFNDAASFSLPPPWQASAGAELPEVLDRRFGKVWRVAAIPLGALSIAMVVAALIGIALMLGMLI